MRRLRWVVVAILCVGLVGALGLAVRRMRLDDDSDEVEPATATAIAPFVYSVIDAGSAGDVKLVGDIDGDGHVDLVVGGSVGEDLRWYRYPSWRPTPIAVPGQEFTTDGELGDLDDDGDLDIVVGDATERENLVWFENPAASSDAGDSRWRRHVVATVDGTVKDVELADFDSDGRLDIATREPEQVVVFFQDGSGGTAADDGFEWQAAQLPDLVLGEEGMTSGDVDVDGDVDLVLRGMWTENPNGTDARTPSSWRPHEIGKASPAFKALVADVDGDGAPEVVFSSSEHVADVVIWSAPEGDPTAGPWVPRPVLAHVEGAHTLRSGDMDGDGDVDLVVAQMHQTRERRVMVVENLDGTFSSSEVHVVGTGGIHNGVVADIGEDGDLDIIGANWTGNPPVELWENQGDRTGAWTYVPVTTRHEQTFGLTFADVDADDDLDIVSGGFWYENPGTADGVRSPDWKQRSLPEGMQAIATLDVDGDDRADVIAQRSGDDLGVFWLEAPSTPDGRWGTVEIGTVPLATHDAGAQGVAVDQVIPGGREELVMPSDGGVYLFEAPTTGSGGAWRRELVSRRPSDEGVAVADVDRDGMLDVIAATGETTHVEWYRAPDWKRMAIADFDSAEFVDRVGAADLNGDGRVDVVATEENGEATDADTVWWEQPPDPGAAWVPHLLAMQGSTHSLDLVDMDGDGDVDVVLAEHKGERRLEIWRNDGSGAFEEAVVSSGHENHLGAKAVDIDGDGDLDLVGIAYDEPETLHLWLNGW